MQFLFSHNNVLFVSLKKKKKVFVSSKIFSFDERTFPGDGFGGIFLFLIFIFEIFVLFEESEKTMFHFCDNHFRKLSHKSYQRQGLVFL
jgi:hypothetical protein